MSSCPSGYTVVAGTIVESATGAAYRTESTVSFPSCQPSAAVGVVALSPGAGGNAGTGRIVYGQLPTYIHVTNPWPVVGGSDARQLQVVQQLDIDGASKALITRVSSELPAQLRAEAGVLGYVATGAPTFSSTSSARAGDEVTRFTVTVTGTVDAIAYPAADAQALLRHALSQRVAAGYQLMSDQIDTSFSADANSSTGGILTGTAAGYEVRSIDPKAIATALRGESLSAARNQLHGDIHITPFAMPWMPLFADHISVLVVVGAPPPS